MKTSRIPCNLNFLGETAFLEGIFCLEYPSRRSEKVNFYFTNCRFSFRKLQIFISQTTDSRFAICRFSFRFVPFRFVSQTTVSRMAFNRPDHLSCLRASIFIGSLQNLHDRPDRRDKTQFCIQEISRSSQSSRWFAIV